ncbi:MAG TPA: ABC transporter permease [Gemmatimonadales bacterium]|nr:ABC transporter permease [Gemmatimonadales bacterium]
MDIVPTGRAQRFYRRCIALYPDSFRREAEGELCHSFDAAWRDAGDRRDRARVTLNVALDLLRTIPAEWLATLSTPRPRGDATPMETLLQDLKYALRSLRGTPLVMLVAACTIAIGVGATTTMFSVANAMLLRTPAGVTDPDRLITVHSMDQRGTSFHSFSYPDFQDLASGGAKAAELSAYTMLPASVRTSGEPRLEAGLLVSANYFPVLGVRMALGRGFTADEDRVGGPPVVIISHGLWQRQFGSDPAILGRTITVNGHALTVVGVTEAGFHGHIAALDFTLWAPVTLMPILSDRGADPLSRRSSSLEIVGRLAPGVARAQAYEVLDAVSIQAGREAGRDWDQTVDVRRYLPLPAEVALPAGGFLGLLILLGGLVLLIASANVANMLLARATARGREMGVRLALGASRGRLIRQLITESLVLFLVGGALGTALASLAVSAIARFQPPLPIPLLLDFHLDMRVLMVSLGITLMAGLLFGLTPALQATRHDLTAVLRDALASARVGRWRLRGFMVSGQVAGTAFLLVVAGLFVRALGRAGNVDVGFNPTDVQVLGMEMRVSNYQGERLTAFDQAVEQRIAQLPGVVSVAGTDFLPLNMGTQQTMVNLEGKPPQQGVGIFETDFASVTPGYFATLQLPLKSGREFTAADRPGAPDVAVINEKLASQLWPGEDPIGKRLRFGSPTEGSTTEIVGVIPNVNVRAIGEAPVPVIYVPLAQSNGRNLALLVRTRPGSAPSAGELRAALHEIDPNLPLSQEGKYSDIIALALLPNRIAAFLATMFGITGVTLAAVGLYGLLAFRVQSRRKEIGIRMALGAGAGEVRRLVMREALLVTLTGLAFGLLIAGGATQLLRSLLFGLSPMDPVTYVAIGGFLLLVCWGAAAGPVRRALRTEPLEVLRHE